MSIRNVIFFMEKAYYELQQTEKKGLLQKIEEKIKQERRDLLDY